MIDKSETCPERWRCAAQPGAPLPCRAPSRTSSLVASRSRRRGRRRDVLRLLKMTTRPPSARRCSGRWGSSCPRRHVGGESRLARASHCTQTPLCTGTTDKAWSAWLGTGPVARWLSPGCVALEDGRYQHLPKKGVTFTLTAAELVRRRRASQHRPDRLSSRWCRPGRRRLVPQGARGQPPALASAPK